MYKIFWSHVFALGIILSITFFHADSNGLMNDVLFSLLTVEMGFFVFILKHCSTSGSICLVVFFLSKQLKCFV